MSFPIIQHYIHNVDYFDNIFHCNLRDWSDQELARRMCVLFNSTDLHIHSLLDRKQKIAHNHLFPHHFPSSLRRNRLHEIPQSRFKKTSLILEQIEIPSLHWKRLSLHGFSCQSSHTIIPLRSCVISFKTSPLHTRTLNRLDHGVPFQLFENTHQIVGMLSHLRYRTLSHSISTLPSHPFLP